MIWAHENSCLWLCSAGNNSLIIRGYCCLNHVALLSEMENGKWKSKMEMKNGNGNQKWNGIWRYNQNWIFLPMAPHMLVEQMGKKSVGIAKKFHFFHFWFLCLLKLLNNNIHYNPQEMSEGGRRSRNADRFKREVCPKCFPTLNAAGSCLGWFCLVLWCAALIPDLAWPCPVLCCVVAPSCLPWCQLSYDMVRFCPVLVGLVLITWWCGALLPDLAWAGLAWSCDVLRLVLDLAWPCLVRCCVVAPSCSPWCWSSCDMVRCCPVLLGLALIAWCCAALLPRLACPDVNCLVLWCVAAGCCLAWCWLPGVNVHICSLRH